LNHESELSTDKQTALKVNYKAKLLSDINIQFLPTLPAEKAALISPY
jgi:hypothetical protein